MAIHVKIILDRKCEETPVQKDSGFIVELRVY
jgi:hypothetical protein